METLLSNWVNIVFIKWIAEVKNHPVFSFGKEHGVSIIFLHVLRPLEEY
jgi:hypothetical protein